MRNDFFFLNSLSVIQGYKEKQQQQQKKPLASQWLLLAAKGKVNAHKRSMHFFMSLMLHNGSARLCLSKINRINFLVKVQCHFLQGIFLKPL